MHSFTYKNVQFIILYGMVLTFEWSPAVPHPPALLCLPAAADSDLQGSLVGPNSGQDAGHGREVRAKGLSFCMVSLICSTHMGTEFPQCQPPWMRGFLGANVCVLSSLWVQAWWWWGIRDTMLSCVLWCCPELDGRGHNFLLCLSLHVAASRRRCRGCLSGFRQPASSASSPGTSLFVFLRRHSGIPGHSGQWAS